MQDRKEIFVPYFVVENTGTDLCFIGGARSLQAAIDLVYETIKEKASKYGDLFIRHYIVTQVYCYSVKLGYVGFYEVEHIFYLEDKNNSLLTRLAIFRVKEQF